MNDILKHMFKMEMLVSIIYLLIGLTLFFLPASVLKTVSIIIGIIALISSIFPIVNYFKMENRILGLGSIVTGVTFAIAGLVMIMYPALLETVIAIMIGVVMIINSINKIEYVITLRDNNVKEWYVSMIFAIITLLVGIFFVVKTWTVINIMTSILGLIIIIYAILDIAETIFVKRKVKYVVSMINEEGKDIKVIEEE